MEELEQATPIEEIDELPAGVIDIDTYVIVRTPVFTHGVGFQTPQKPVRVVDMNEEGTMVFLAKPVNGWVAIENVELV